MKKKIALMVTSLVLVVAMAVGGTLAYLTSTTQTVTNTFTFGNVTIDLDETKVDSYGDAVTPPAKVNPGETQTYKLMPGHEYTKDPTVYVTAGSEECYLYVKVVNGISSIEAEGGTTIAKQMETNGWQSLGDSYPNVYYLNTTVDARESQTNIKKVVFENFQIKDELTNQQVEDLNGATITIAAYAVQADGFDTALAAWTGANFS